LASSYSIGRKTCGWGRQKSEHSSKDDTDYDKDFQTWVGRWLYSFCNYIETKCEEEDSMAKLLLFISEARLEGKVNTGLINALVTFI
jgi:hypothetical protein